MTYLNPMRVLLPILAALLSVGCTTLPSLSEDQYVDALDGANVTDNHTRYSQSLECLRQSLVQSKYRDQRFSVGRVSDFTGKEDLTNGKRITQGASLMVISALNRAGVPLVERFDTSIADIELKYADNKLITDDLETRDYRKIMSGTLAGSDYHVVGGVTEVNYNIRSGSVDSSIQFLGLGARYFVMNVAVDLRLVNTKTLEVVNVQSLQKQIIGTELSGGFFRVFSDGVVDIAASERTQEPIQRGIRMVIEQAVFNMLNEFYGLSVNNCQDAGRNQIKHHVNQQAPNAAPNNSPNSPVLPSRYAPEPRQAKPAATTVKSNQTVTSNEDLALIQPQFDEAQAAQVLGLIGGDANSGKTLSGGNIPSSNSTVTLDQSNSSINARSTTEDLMQQSQPANLNASLERTELTGFMDERLTGENNSNNQSRKEEMKEKLLWGTKPIIR